MAYYKNSLSRKHTKLVVVGDFMCGKTSLLFAFKDDEFIVNYDATVCETYVADIHVDGQIIDLVLFDTAGHDGYDRIRPLSYPDTDVVLLCFAVDDPLTTISIIEKWMPEVRYFCGKCPIILVACKKDLRNDPNTIELLKEHGEKPITKTAGKLLAAQIKAEAYMECSAKTREGVRDVFVQAARMSLKYSSQIKAYYKCLLF